MSSKLVASAFCLVSTCGVLAAQQISTSVVGTDYDFITASDPSAFDSLKFEKRGRAEMPDKRDDGELFQQAFVFQALFTDRTRLRIYIAADVGSQEAARREAMRYVHPLGKLPTALRSGVSRLVVHSGGKKTTAFSDEGLIVIYADNATERISTHDLEETIFHESVHAAWDKTHANSAGWTRAQMADGQFVTLYAKKKPRLEDLAESALFAYTLTHHKDRIPAADRKQIAARIPNRIMYVAELIPPDEPVFYNYENRKEAQ